MRSLGNGVKNLGNMVKNLGNMVKKGRGKRIDDAIASMHFGSLLENVRIDVIDGNVEIA